jgi:hypothetical protein
MKIISQKTQRPYYKYQFRKITCVYYQNHTKNNKHSKGKAVPLHAMKACRGSGGMALLVLNWRSSGRRHAPAALPQVTTDRKLCEANSRSGNFGEKSLTSAVIRTPHRSARNLVTILTELPRLPLRYGNDLQNPCYSLCDYYKVDALKSCGWTA